MKFTIVVRRTVIHEETREVEAKDVVSAMKRAELLAGSGQCFVRTLRTDWSVTSVKTEKDES